MSITVWSPRSRTHPLSTPFPFPPLAVLSHPSAVKMVNQLLAGVHIATAAEAMALGARAGLNPRTVFDIISHAAGNSW